MYIIHMKCLCQVLLITNMNYLTINVKHCIAPLSPSSQLILIYDMISGDGYTCWQTFSIYGTWRSSSICRKYLHNEHRAHQITQHHLSLIPILTDHIFIFFSIGSVLACNHWCGYKQWESAGRWVLHRAQAKEGNWAGLWYVSFTCWVFKSFETSYVVCCFT